MIQTGIRYVELNNLRQKVAGSRLHSQLPTVDPLSILLLHPQLFRTSSSPTSRERCVEDPKLHQQLPTIMTIPGDHRPSSTNSTTDN